MVICVYGAASSTIDEIYIKETQKLGLELAKRGHGLVFGAGGTGLMGAVAKGVSEGGGHVKGVIPTFFTDADVEIVAKDCDEVVYTETMRERKQEMEDSADAFIMVPGGIGTFEEFFEILTSKQLLQHNKPIAVFNINGYFDELQHMMKVAVKKEFVKEGVLTLYSFFDDIDEMLDFVETDKGTSLGLDELKR
ncbi:MAG: TIGR00730 family Rossman fold protein [Ruminococcaceae bacterium]|nr:TIGR00730 family Rossman fold protein [Oscillospiraceae bacterium]